MAALAPALPTASPGAPPYPSEFSSATSAFITACENAGCDVKALKSVKKKYSETPYWPSDHKSGLTMGIGYDLKQQTPAQLQNDWGGVLSPSEIATLGDYVPTVLRGKPVPPLKLPSQAALKATQAIHIRYEDAVKVFEDTVLPRYQTLANGAFPGLDTLDPYTQGAVDSMVYNRGAAFYLKDKQGKDSKSPASIARYTHFMEIKGAVFRKDTRAIAATIRDMKREHIDPKSKKGLRKRRDTEADFITQHQAEIDRFYQQTP